MNFCQSSMYSYGLTHFSNNKINVLISRSENLYILKNHLFKGERKKFSKTLVTSVFDKILHYTKKLSFKNQFFNVLANFIFVSHLKIHPAVHLNTSKAVKKKSCHCSQKEKFIKSLLAIVFLFLTCVKKR